MQNEINLMRDKPFKMLFSDPIIFVDFLQSIYKFLGIDEKINLYSLNSQVLIPADNINSKNFYSDVIGITDTRLIILEAYGKYRVYEEKKSFSYASRLYGSQLFEKENYDELKKVLCINIISGKSFKKTTKGIECYRMIDGIEVLDCDPIIFVNIFLDNIASLEYTLSKQRFFKYLKILCCSRIEEIKEIVKGDAIMNNTIKFINKFFSTPGNTREDRIESDKEDIKRYWNQVGEENGKKEGLKLGKKEGLKLGKKEGLKLGEEKQLKETISKLYSKNFSIDNISKLLDIPVDKVKNHLINS